MARPDPYHRIAAIQEALREGTTPLDADVRTVVEAITGTTPNPAIAYAWRKYGVPLERTVLDSFLIADAPLEEVQRITGVPVGALVAYARYLFDVTVFQDRLERASYVDRQRGYLTDGQLIFLNAAIQQGDRYLAWLVNPNAIRIAPKEVFETAMTDGHFMGLTHRGVNVEKRPDIIKNARCWQQGSIQAATGMIRASLGENDEAQNDIEIALTVRESVDSAETAGALPPHDIIH